MNVFSYLGCKSERTAAAGSLEQHKETSLFAQNLIYISPIYAVWSWFLGLYSGTHQLGPNGLLLSMDSRISYALSFRNYSRIKQPFASVGVNSSPPQSLPIFYRTSATCTSRVLSDHRSVDQTSCQYTSYS